MKIRDLRIFMYVLGVWICVLGVWICILGVWICILGGLLQLQFQESELVHKHLSQERWAGVMLQMVIKYLGNL